VKCSEVLQCSDVLLVLSFLSLCIWLYVLYALFNSVTYVFLLLCLCTLIEKYALFWIFCSHRAKWHSSATLTEVFFCAFSSVIRQMPCKDEALSALFLISELCCSMYCFCRLCFSVCCLCTVLYYCQRVATQLQLNISYRIIILHAYNFMVWSATCFGYR